MNRNHTFSIQKNMTHSEVNKKIAIHEAGHAAAIYLGCKQKGLSTVFFRIFITQVGSDFAVADGLSENNTNALASLDRGRQFTKLPVSINEATQGFSAANKTAYLCAFEADMINLLVGPLAEAKYVALRDDELINPRLVNIDALHNYGGASDLERVSEYLACFDGDQEFKEQKINELFLAAFSFVNRKSNWRAITALAEYIVHSNKNIINYNEIIAVLDAAQYRTCQCGGFAKAG